MNEASEDDKGNKGEKLHWISALERFVTFKRPDNPRKMIKSFQVLSATHGSWRRAFTSQKAEAKSGSFEIKSEILSELVWLSEQHDKARKRNSLLLY